MPADKPAGREEEIRSERKRTLAAAEARRHAAHAQNRQRPNREVPGHRGPEDLEEPGRRSGPRGDATRAPSQVPRPGRAAGCRPSASRDRPESEKSLPSVLESPASLASKVVVPIHAEPTHPQWSIPKPRAPPAAVAPRGPSCAVQLEERIRQRESLANRLSTRLNLVAPPPSGTSSRGGPDPRGTAISGHGDARDHRGTVAVGTGRGSPAGRCRRSRRRRRGSTCRRPFETSGATSCLARASRSGRTNPVREPWHGGTHGDERSSRRDGPGPTGTLLRHHCYSRRLRKADQ